MGTKSEVFPHKWEQNQKWLPHPCLLGGPKKGWKCYVTPAFSGIPNIGEQNQKWLPHPSLPGGPKEGGSAMSPLRSWGSPTEGNENKSGPQKGGSATSPLHSRGSRDKGTKSKVAHKWAEVLRNPDVLSVPGKGFKNGRRRAPGKIPQCGCLRAVLNKKKLVLNNHPEQRGTESELAASPLPSRGPKRMRKCYVTPAFWGVPRTKLWMCSPKEYHQKIFTEMVCLRRKTPLKPPHRQFLKKRGGGFQNPPRYRISQNPSPLDSHALCTVEPHAVIFGPSYDQNTPLAQR